MSSSLMFLTLDKKMNAVPEPIIAHPISVANPSFSFKNKRVPTKMLKMPFPIPVIRKKKFLPTHGILKLLAIMIRPKNLE